MSTYVCVSVCLCVSLSACVWVCLPVCESVCLCVSLSACVWVWLPVCESVCMSVCKHIYGATQATFTKLFVHVAYGCGSVLLRHGDKIGIRRGSFGAFSSHWQCIVICSMQIASDKTIPLLPVGVTGVHSTHDVFAANNIMQQKGSFHHQRRWLECIVLAKCELRLPCYFWVLH